MYLSISNFNLSFFLIYNVRYAIAHNSSFEQSRLEALAKGMLVGTQNITVNNTILLIFFSSIMLKFEFEYSVDKLYAVSKTGSVEGS